jgi:hypothetical protein
VGQCAFCKADAELCEAAEFPICAKCWTEHEARRTCPVSAREIRFALIQYLVDAIAREQTASDEFNTAIGQFPHEIRFCVRQLPLPREVRWDNPAVEKVTEARMRPPQLFPGGNQFAGCVLNKLASIRVR